MAQWVKNPPAMQETQEMQVQSLVREDPLEEKMATHSGIHPWEMPWTEEPGGLQSMGLQKSRTGLSDQNNNKNKAPALKYDPKSFFAFVPNLYEQVTYTIWLP